MSQRPLTILDQIRYGKDEWRPSAEVEQRPGFNIGMAWGIQLGVAKAMQHIEDFHDGIEPDGVALEVELIGEVDRIKSEAIRWLDRHNVQGPGQSNDCDS